MTPWTLVKRSLRFYWRTHIGVLLAAALGTAVLVGALVVGDSVRHSLRGMALARLGRVHLAVVGGDRLFRDALADEIGAELGVTAAPMLLLRGVADNDARTARANGVQVLGVERGFWLLAPAAAGPANAPGDGQVVLNRRLAEQLHARTGERILLRVSKPGGLSGDAPLAAASDVALPLLVSAVVGDGRFGRFDLQGTQIPPYNAYVPLEWLQRKVGQVGRANVILLGAGASGDMTPDLADAAIRKTWRLADAQLELRDLPELGTIELRTSRVFMDRPVAVAAAEVSREAAGVFTYFVNEFRRKGGATPYSAITGIGPLNVGAAAGALIPPDLRGLKDDQIVINDWLADDLGAKPGDAIDLKYYVVAPGRRLRERTARLNVRSVVKMEGLAADRGLMPDIPGLAEIDDPRKWHFGIPIDFDRIRRKDDRYWERFRGTPKAFVGLAATRRLWGSRFGDLTAVRYPRAAGAEQRISAALRSRLDPAAVGLFFQPVRARALAGSRGASDFGLLFMGFSFFLVVSALLLMGLMFALGAEQRSEEIGTLLALGLSPRRVRTLMLLEGAALALPGVLLGVAGGLLYTRGMLYALVTVWHAAVNTSLLGFHAESGTVAIGAVVSLAAGLATMWLVLRGLGRRTPRELLGLAQGAGALLGRRRGGGRKGLICAAACVAAAGVLAALAGAGGGEHAAAVFFGAGALLLAGGAAAAYACIAMLGAAAAAKTVTLAGLGIRNAARRIGRSLAVVVLLACGTFLVVAVGAFRQDPSHRSQERSAGTGGFALYGESSLPVFEDLNSGPGRKAYSLDAGVMAAARVVALRVGGGEDASCFNLNRAQQPRLVGLRSEQLASRRAFTFVKAFDPPAAGSPWRLLDRAMPGGAVPAVGDEATVKWGLGKSVGDVLAYTDQRGRSFHVKIVGVIANSILQGSLIISEDRFIEKFPSSGGYRMFLVDAPAGGSVAVAGAMARGLEDVGLELTPAAGRLAMFGEIANAYISIFQVLGGLGLILGSFGLGLVVLRNVLERRSELAILRAVGFRTGALHRMVLWEHWVLLAMGLACGVAAGLIAVLPALLSPAVQVPYLSLGLTVLAVAAGGMAWTHLAARAALRGPLLDALRNE